MPHPEIALFFFIIAFIYASVGFGGGSSYLAILSLYALPFQEMRLIALICNIIVVSGGAIIFAKNGQVNWRKILPIAVLSVPMAFVGASIKLKQETFFVILGFSLVVAALLLWIKTSRENGEDILPGNRPLHYVKDGFIGGAIGFLSGMVGIGGGIFLSPLLNLLKWDTAKKIAATASIFILVNSVSGIAGQLTSWQTQHDYTTIIILCIAVLLGGQIGSRTGAVRLNAVLIKRLTAVLVLAAGIEVLHKHL